MAAVMAYLREFSFVTMVLRLLLAALAGGIIGYGRTRRRMRAGLRTYMLTAIGAALTVLISMYEYQMLTTVWTDAAALGDLKYDVSRFAAQVINGIGFLAAGSIIAVAHGQMSGLTTASGLFASVCMGIAAGAGFYEAVLLSLLAIKLALDWMFPLEFLFKRRIRNITLYVEFDDLDDISVISDTIEAQDAQIFDMDVERTGLEEGLCPAAIFTLKLSQKNTSHSEMLSSVAELPCVSTIQEIIA